jgi:hypothetical protein
MTVEEMIEALRVKTAKVGCRLDLASNQAGMMYVEFGYVEGPLPEETPSSHYPNAESRYMTCLHELGHFFHAHTQGRPFTDFYRAKAFSIYSPEYWEDTKFYFTNGVLYSEAQAWNWALNNCDIPSEEILPETRDFMWNTCLASYFNNARQVGFETPGQMLYNGDRGYVQFAYGKPDQYFFQTKRRILEGDLKEEMPEPKLFISNQIQDFDNNTQIQWLSGTTISSTSNTTRY